jgi:hypothetical protein
VTGPPRDWDKELAEIDKVIAKQPAGGPRPAPQSGAAALPASRSAGSLAPAATGRAALTAWVRVGLAVAVAVGVAFAWPYRHTCGIPLYGYLGAACGVVLAGIWSAVTSWRRRLGLAHLISLLVVLCGAALIAKSVLDRSDYARHPATWSCR